MVSKKNKKKTIDITKIDTEVLLQLYHDKKLSHISFFTELKRRIKFQGSIQEEVTQSLIAVQKSLNFVKKELLLIKQEAEKIELENLSLKKDLKVLKYLPKHDKYSKDQMILMFGCGFVFAALGFALIMLMF